MQTFPLKKVDFDVCGHWHYQQMQLASGVVCQQNVAFLKLNEETENNTFCW